MKRSSLCCSRSARTSAKRFQPDDAQRQRPLAHAATFRRADGAAAHSRHSTKRARPSMVPPIMTFSSTDASPMMRGVWKVRAMPRPARVCGAPRGSATSPSRTVARCGRVVAGDDVQRRGLAAAVRADQPVHLRPAAISQVEPVDRAHAAEAQHDAAADAIGCAARPCVEQRGQQVRARHDGAVASERLAVLEIQQVGDAAGHQQHDHQQQRGIEEGGPRDQRRGEFRQHGQQDGAEQRAEDGAAPADQDGDEEQDRQVEGEGVGRDVGLQRGEQPAGDRRRRRR